ncbi:unnamed protein product [Triticum turgidum subsp. durum]|uniref:Uncharacterized protein n=1 Tax=Triticum turgidum subsp. durum TaxID=4567 RepID=A0A9R1Q3T2_TRITD|nr:unnamed protein product [Triticum turgidum subsp. durum]
MAQGADNPNALAFAADQFDPNHPRECAARSSLFNWWYFSLAVGITISVGVVGYIQENIGWGIGFGMLCVIMLGAFVVFFLGTPTYRLYAPTPGAENPFALLARSLAALAQHDNATSSSLLGNKKEYQFMTLFNKQARTLDRRIFGSLELPIYDRVLVPMLRRVTGTLSGLTLLQRVGTGMTLTLATMLVAALVETRRLETAREHGLVDNADATVPMCWAWLVPQYVLIGVAGVFAEVGMQEFFYDQMPSELRSLGMALYYSVIGMGNFISGALISLIDHITSSGGGDSWFADNLNRAHLNYFYWLLAGLSATELALFLRCASTYVYSHKRLR